MGYLWKKSRIESAYKGFLLAVFVLGSLSWYDRYEHWSFELFISFVNFLMFFSYNFSVSTTFYIDIKLLIAF